MAKVRQFKTGVEGQGASSPLRTPTENAVPEISSQAVDSITASAPVKIQARAGNPRQRRYKNKTYSLLQEDIDLIEVLLVEIRQSGLYERGRGDIVRAGVRLLASLSPEEKRLAVQAVESLKGK